LRGNRASNRVTFPSLFVLCVLRPFLDLVENMISYAVGGRSSIHLCRGLRCCTITVTGLPHRDGGSSPSESANACRCDFGRTGQGRTVEAEAATVTTEPTKVSPKRKETRERRCWIVGEKRNRRRDICSFVGYRSAQWIEDISMDIAYYCNDIWRMRRGRTLRLAFSAQSTIWLESKVLGNKAHHLGPLLRHTWKNKTTLILYRMGISFSSLFASLTSLAGWKEKDVRILMLGLDSAGKTTILYRMQVCGISHGSSSKLTVGSFR